jgi:hypothetical protein
MADAQLVTLATAFLAAIIAVLFNNSRISDLRSSTDKRFDDLRGTMEGVHRHIDDKFALLPERLQRMEDNIMRITGDHEERIQRLEGKK